MEELKKLMREIPDFPKKGINFIDITPLLLDPSALRKAVGIFVERYRSQGITRVLGIESRGFIFAPSVAMELGAGFVPVRKPGKLPYDTISQEYELEYGTDTVEMHVDAVTAEDKVLIIDDLAATGGTARATAELVARQGATVVELGFLVELTFLDPASALAPHSIFSIIQY